MTEPRNFPDWGLDEAGSSPVRSTNSWVISSVLVEHFVRNEGVVGSSPTSIHYGHLAQLD